MKHCKLQRRLGDICSLHIALTAGVGQSESKFQGLTVTFPRGIYGTSLAVEADWGSKLPTLKKRTYAMNALLTKASGPPVKGGFISSGPRCIKVVFIFLSPTELQIKSHMNRVSMDTNMETQPEAARQTPSFDPSPMPEPPALTRPVPSPETGRATFANIRQETNLLDASIRALKQRKSITTTALKLVAFSLNMPTAKRVQLSADFTDWDASPIDMIRFADGVWSTTVPLPSGVYAYHFLVDGNWHGDPQASPRGSNSKGVPIAFIKVK